MSTPSKTIQTLFRHRKALCFYLISIIVMCLFIPFNVAKATSPSGYPGYLLKCFERAFSSGEIPINSSNNGEKRDQFRKQMSSPKTRWKCLEKAIMYGEVSLNNYSDRQVKDLLSDAIEYGAKDQFVFNILQTGVDLNIDTRNHGTYDFVVQATRFGRLSVIKLLIKYGAKLPTVDTTSNYSSFQKAITENNDKKDILSYFLTLGLDINTTDGGDYSTILSISDIRDFEWLQFLLENGANPNILRNLTDSIYRSRKTIFDRANDADDSALVNLLSSYGALGYKELLQNYNNIISAIQTRNYAQLKNLLLQKAPYFPDSYTPYLLLAVAIASNDEKIVEILLSMSPKFKEGKIIRLSRYSHNGLIFAPNNVNVINTLLQHGFKANESTVMLSIHNDNTELVKLLLSIGVKFQTKERSGLQLAIKNGNSDLVDLLLRKGADVNWTQRQGSQTLLELAYVKGNRDIIDSLHNAGGKLSQAIYINESHLPAFNNDQIAFQAIKYNDMDVIREYIISGHRFELDSAGVNDNILRSAADIGNLKVLRLVQKHSNIVFGMSDLVVSIINNTITATDIDSTNSDVHHLDRWGRSALYYAVINNKDDIARALLKTGISVPDSLLENHATTISASLLKALLETRTYHDKTLTIALSNTMQAGDTEKAEILVKLGANVNYKHGYNYPAIFLAAANGLTELVMTMLKNGADPTSHFFQYRLESLHISAVTFAAAQWKAPNLASEIVKFHNARDSNAVYGDARLTTITSTSNTDALDLMLDVDLSGIDELLQRAVLDINFEAASVLLKHGADPHAKDEHGVSVFELLKKRQNEFKDSATIKDQNRLDDTNKMLHILKTGSTPRIE